MNAYQAIIERRSLRHFNQVPIARPLVQKLLYAACLAPAPHHTRPWRFVLLETRQSRARLAESMGVAWRRDLEGDGVSTKKMDALLARSRRQIEGVPSLVLACLVAEGLRAWPDERRRRAEFRMAAQSVGCALENIMVAAHAEGLAAFWISAPLFCQDAVREALELPAEYEAQALIALGYPAADAAPRARPEPDLATLVQMR